MLDLLERLGFDFDSLDSGQSLRLHGRLRPHAIPQSICSSIIELNMLCIAWIIGFEHCARSWRRYHDPDES